MNKKSYNVKLRNIIYSSPLYRYHCLKYLSNPKRYQVSRGMNSNVVAIVVARV